MKYASLNVLVLVLAAGGLLAACGNGSDSPAFSSGGASSTTSTTTTDAATTTTTSGSGGAGGGGGSAPTDGGAGCLPQCSIDSDCQNSCPATPTGANCCDAQTSLCYVSSTPTCPMTDDGGTVMPPY